MALAPLLYNITFDSQTRILYFWDKAGHEIYHFEIPSPAPAAYDTATGTISEVTLPSAHSYIDVTFDSLRYYVKGTLSNTGTTVAFGTGTYWYYGTITWTDESLEDLSSKIKLADPSDPNDINVSQDVFRIIFITDGISGYSPKYDGYPVGGQVTAYNYNNGVHTITYYDTTNWINGADSGRLHIRYLDDTTTFNNLSAFDLVTISNGVLSKDTTTDRYAMYNAWNGSITVNAKYIPSPAPPLPTVSSESWVNFTARIEDRYKDITANEQIDVHVGSSFNTVPYDSSLVYAISKIYYNTVIIGHGELQCVDNSGVLAVKNITSSTIRADGGNYQTCDSTDATVITVYDSSNNPYNAFQYTSDGTDYYYVLDGTQTDWTDDLESIGYQQSRKAYANANKTDRYMFRNTPSNVYDSDGNTIPFADINLLGVFMADGTSLGTYGFQLTNNGGLLALNYYGGSGTYAGYAEYTILYKV